MARLGTTALIFALVAITVVQADLMPISTTATFNGQVNKGSIYVSEPYMLAGNPINPVNATIHYPSLNYDANVCFNMGGPISGVNLASTCPDGGFAVLSNNDVGTPTAAKSDDRAIHEVKLARKGTRFVGNERLAMEVEDESSEGQAVETTVSGELYIGPTGTLMVTVPGYNDTFTVTLGYEYCEYGTYPVETTPGNFTCEVLDNNVINLVNANNRTISTTLSAFGSNVFMVQVPQANFLNVTMPTIFGAEFMSGYLPSSDWSMDVPSNVEDSSITYTLNTPGRTDGYESIYVRVDNLFSTALSGEIFFGLSNCPTATDIGPGCLVSNVESSNSTTQGTEVYELNAIVSAGGNNGTSVEFDLSEAEQDYAYFVLPRQNLPVLSNNSYYVRVSFANNVIDATGGQTVAPTVYAKMDGYPSAQSYDYRVNGSLVNQVIVPVSTNSTGAANAAAAGDGTWYFAVETPSDFSTWAGANCANLCDGNEHGNCYCNNQLCNVTTSNGQDVGPLYQMPTNIQDSGGACRCTDDNYDQSFDCSEKTNKNSTLYIVLIAVGGAIVLAVAIGVPVYCYFQNRKRARYDRV